VSTAVAVRPQVSLEEARSAFEHSLQGKMQYARLLATSGLLPKAYQRNPANVLWALEYAEALHISPVVAMMSIHVIEGKPSAGAGLISGLVRREGHKLRLRGDSNSATCEIIRSDDPDYTFSFTWDMKRAQVAGLTGKDNWKKNPAAMLQARATTECARAACQDVLFGLVYTPEELGSTLLDDELAATAGATLPPQAAAEGEVQEDAQAASPDALRRVAEAFSAAGWDETESVRPAIGLIIDRAFGDDDPALTAEEAEFVATEVEAFSGDLAGLHGMLSERRDAQ
jgi:hypothetical protein